MRRSIVWFRNDLRLHDNEALIDAINHNDEIIPIFILDPRIFRGTTKSGFKKTSKHRLRFILESLQDLRENLQKINSTLYIREGIPEQIIPQIARETKTTYIYCNRERTDEEVKVQDSMESKLWSIGQEIRYYRGKMLYYTADLPFPITHCPDQFASFRKEVEKIVKIRKPIATPENKLPQLSIHLEAGIIPSIEEFGFEDSMFTKGITFKGGETEALKNLKYYIWESNHINQYKETRNHLLGRNYSSKFSPYLSAGCLSPKLVHEEIVKYEKERIENDSTYRLKYELLWRDFFRFMGKKHGNKIFQLGGTKSFPPERSLVDMTLFEKWKTGRTGIPFIDANMMELNKTGFMSSRGRQLVASFLINDLKINWILGAEYFESMLIDYDPCSNYGNWNYMAGVHSDAHQDKYINIPSQARKYDPKAEYMKYWLPELIDIPSEYLFDPLSPKAKDNFANTNYCVPCA